ncbi:MAG: PilZ domain-containing protein [Elusimicrobiota bacterium]|nr:PilZ domain-containing protein [Elusimicrobiota bacterium]
MPEQIERRRHPRIPFVTSVEILYKLKDRIFHGITRNISLGGIAIETEQHLRVGDIYEFKFMLPSGEIIKPKGNVVWEQLSAINTNLYGVKFTKLGFFQKLKLKKFIQNQLQTQ